MKDVSIIICAFNEEKNIADVVKACCSCNPMADVLVVDDGSTDRTAEVLEGLRKKYKFRSEHLPENKGKSCAMVHGVEHCDRELILFFDADVSNITRQHFKSLLDPLRKGRADMVLGQPRDTMIDYRINPFKSLTGERVMYRKDILPILEDIREIRFGVETFINLYFQAEGKRIHYVLLDGLSHPNTFEKVSPIKATRKYISEGQEIARTYINNYDLIVRSVENSINRVGKRTRNRISQL
ncbi:MAG: glycosyltransferase family 2 protein [Bacteroidota bacterium]|nr:glycosyltransferase family 2 protein [Bacteroidota bacterium]